MFDLFCTAFCLFYVVHGLLKELQYEIYVLILAILVVLVYCIIEYTVNTEGHSRIKEVTCMLFLFVVCWSRHYVRILIWYGLVKLLIETIFMWWKLRKMLLNDIIYFCWVATFLKVFHILCLCWLSIANPMVWLRCPSLLE